MRSFRTILALLIALSVAMLPTAGAMTASAAPVSEPAETAVQATAQDVVQPDVTVSAMDADTHDCCPPSQAPCGMPMGKCLASACAQSIVFSAVPALQMTHPFVPGARLIALSDSAFQAQPSSPPLRPPRI